MLVKPMNKQFLWILIWNWLVIIDFLLTCDYLLIVMLHIFKSLNKPNLNPPNIYLLKETLEQGMKYVPN